ncbi:hypothetical protein GO491_12150, partial [Flavobacteriaceae bacterium Ap0902]|nr:hypothetical protein [Flavobacteriaceae bacterium Ap0902]
DKNIGAFNLDKVNAIKDNKLGKTLNAISYPVDVFAASTGHPVLGGLSYSTKAYNIIGEGIIGMDTGQFKDFNNQVLSNAMNFGGSTAIKHYIGKEAQAVYEAIIAPLINDRINN